MCFSMFGMVLGWLGVLMPTPFWFLLGGIATLAGTIFGIWNGSYQFICVTFVAHFSFSLSWIYFGYDSQVHDLLELWLHVNFLVIPVVIGLLLRRKVATGAYRSEIFAPEQLHNRRLVPAPTMHSVTYSFPESTPRSVYSRLFPGSDMSCYLLIIPFVRDRCYAAGVLLHHNLPLYGPVIAHDLGYLLAYLVIRFDLKDMVLPSLVETDVYGVMFLHFNAVSLQSVRDTITILLTFDGYVGAGGVDPMHMIDVAATTGASTIAANEAAQSFREILNNMVVVKVILTAEEQNIILNERRFVRFSRVNDVSHDHPLMAAYREIIRIDFGRVINLCTTNDRVLVLGASMREYRSYNSNSHIHFQFANLEAKDLDRTVTECLSTLRKLKIRKHNKKNNKAVSIENDLMSVDQAMKEWRDTRVLPDRILLWDNDKGFTNKSGSATNFDTLVFQDVGYNFTAKDWGNLFRSTGALRAYGYMCLPWQLVMPDIVSPPGYVYKRDGNAATFAYHGYCTGYTHNHDAWSTLMKTTALTFKDFSIAIEFVSRVGPMTLISLTRTTRQEVVVRHLELPNFLKSTSLLNISECFDRKTCVLDMNNLKYFSVRTDEVHEAINYGLDIAKDSLNFNNILLFIRRRSSGISLVTKEISKTWTAPRGLLPEFAMVVYLYVSYLSNDYMNFQKVTKNMYFSRFTEMLRRKIRPITNFCKSIYDYFAREDIFKLLIKDLDHAYWQSVTLSKFSKFEKVVDTNVRPEDLLHNSYNVKEEEEIIQEPECNFCLELKDAVGSQIFTCERQKEEDFYHNFTLSNPDINALRSMLADTSKDTIGIKTIKEDALKHVPLYTFSNRARVQYICGPPGTGKSYAIRALATKQDLVVAAFSRLKQDYTNFIHPITGIRTSLKFMTQHIALSAMNHSRIFVDEYTAMPYELLAVIVNNCAADEVFLVGDHRQTSLINEVEGIAIPSRLDISQIRTHELVRNFRNPMDVVNVLNFSFGYRMLPTNKRKGFKIDTTQNFDKYPDYTPLFFRHTSATNFGIDESTGNKVTVRANQGATYDNVKLVILNGDKNLFDIPSMVIVALSRHRQNCVLLFEESTTTAGLKGVIANAMHKSTNKLPNNLSPIFVFNEQKYLTEFPENYLAKKEDDEEKDDNSITDSDNPMPPLEDDDDDPDNNGGGDGHRGGGGGKDTKPPNGSDPDDHAGTGITTQSGNTDQPEEENVGRDVTEYITTGDEVQKQSTSGTVLKIIERPATVVTKTKGRQSQKLKSTDKGNIRNVVQSPLSANTPTMPYITGNYPPRPILNHPNQQGLFPAPVNMYSYQAHLRPQMINPYLNQQLFQPGNYQQQPFWGQNNAPFVHVHNIGYLQNPNSVLNTTNFSSGPYVDMNSNMYTNFSQPFMGNMQNQSVNTMQGYQNFNVDPTFNQPNFNINSGFNTNVPIMQPVIHTQDQNIGGGQGYQNFYGNPVHTNMQILNTAIYNQEENIGYVQTTEQETNTLTNKIFGVVTSGQSLTTSQPVSHNQSVIPDDIVKQTQDKSKILTWAEIVELEEKEEEKDNVTDDVDIYDNEPKQQLKKDDDNDGDDDQQQLDATIRERQVTVYPKQNIGGTSTSKHHKETSTTTKQEIMSVPQDNTCLLKALADLTGNDILDVWYSMVSALGIYATIKIKNRIFSTKELWQFCVHNDFQIMIVSDSSMLTCGVKSPVIGIIKHTKQGEGHFYVEGTKRGEKLGLTIRNNLFFDYQKFGDQDIQKIETKINQLLGYPKTTHSLTVQDVLKLHNHKDMNFDIWFIVNDMLKFVKDNKFWRALSSKLGSLNFGGPDVILTGASEVQIKALPNIPVLILKDSQPQPFNSENTDFLQMARLFADPTYISKMLVEPEIDTHHQIVKLEQSPFDSFKMLSEDYMTIDEYNLALTNQESFDYISDKFGTGNFDLTTLDNLNQRGHPQLRKEQVWSLLNVAPGVTYSKKNLAQTLHCLQSRYLTTDYLTTYNNESKELATVIATLFFEEHMELNFNIFNEQDINKTVLESEHSMKIKNYDKQATFDTFGDRDVRFTMKDVFKPFKTKIDVFKAGQGISAWSKDMQSIFQTAFRIINKHFISCLKPHVVYDNGIDEQALMLRVNALFSILPSTAINGVIDATACDSGQNKFTQMIERVILEKLGVSDIFLDWYYQQREEYILKGYGVKAKVKDIKTSGEPATLLNNTILMACLMNYLIRGEGPCVLVIKGDDGLKRQANLNFTAEAQIRLKKHLKMQFKIDIDIPITFCGYFLYKQYLYPDIIRKVFKILGHKFKDYEHFSEYQQSLRDWILVINKLGLSDICLINSQAYELEFEYVYSLLHSIISLTHINQKQFSKHFKLRTLYYIEEFVSTQPWKENVHWYHGYN